MIANVSPFIYNFDDTYNNWKYAERGNPLFILTYLFTLFFLIFLIPWGRDIEFFLAKNEGRCLINNFDEWEFYGIGYIVCLLIAQIVYQINYDKWSSNN